MMFTGTKSKARSSRGVVRTGDIVVGFSGLKCIGRTENFICPWKGSESDLIEKFLVTEWRGVVTWGLEKR